MSLCFSILSVAGVVPLTLVLLVVRLIADIRPVVDKWAGAAVMGSVVYYLVVRSDPFGYVTWLLD